MSDYVFSVRPLPIAKAITGAATTIIADATNQAITVPSFEIDETSGGTGNLTVEVWDGTNHVYLGDEGGTAWNAQAVTAHKSYRFKLTYPVPKGSVLRMINSSGNFSVFGTQLPTV